MNKRSSDKSWLNELHERDDTTHTARSPIRSKKAKSPHTASPVADPAHSSAATAPTPCSTAEPMVQDASERNARVVATFGRHSVAQDATGKRWQVFSRGKKVEVAVGDYIQMRPSGQEQAWIEQITERRNLVYRSDEFRSKTFAANLDQVILVLAISPPYSPALVCRTVVACEISEVPLIVLLNKTDLIDNLAQEIARLRVWVPDHVLIKPVSLTEGNQQIAEALRSLTHDKTSLVLGQSGMGKSTLVNLLVPNAQVATAGISEALNSGKHTTTATLMHRLPSGGAIIDSPGFQAFGLAHLSEGDIHTAFADITELAQTCRFHNCQHQQEPDCAVQSAIEQGLLSQDRLALFHELLSQRRG